MEALIQGRGNSAGTFVVLHCYPYRIDFFLDISVRLERQDNGRFSDDDLAKILLDATQNVAGAFKSRGTPAVMRIMEILGIEAGRKWGVCTLNEFRKFIGLKRTKKLTLIIHEDAYCTYLIAYSSFKEWNPDPEVAVRAFFTSFSIHLTRSAD